MPIAFEELVNTHRFWKARHTVIEEKQEVQRAEGCVGKEVRTTEERRKRERSDI